MSVDRGDTIGPLVLTLPEGWSYEHQVTIRLPPPATPLAGTEFHPNIVVVKRPVAIPGTPVETIADERRRQLARHLPEFEFDLSMRFEVLGRPAVRLMYTWHNGVHKLRQMLVLVVVETSQYELTYSDASARFGDTVSEFERWLGGLGIVGAPPA